MSRRTGHEPQERRHDPQCEHGEDAGLTVVVGPRDHEAAGDQPDERGRLLMVLHADPEELALRDQHDEPGHDGERPLADQ